MAAQITPAQQTIQAAMDAADRTAEEMGETIARLFDDPATYDIDFSRPWSPSEHRFRFACHLLTTNGSCYAHGDTPAEALANAMTGIEQQRS